MTKSKSELKRQAAGNRYFLAESEGAFGLYDRECIDVYRNPFRIMKGTREECVHVKAKLDKAIGVSKNV